MSFSLKDRIINILWIRYWDSTNHFAGSFRLAPLRHHPIKSVFNRRRLSFASVPLDESNVRIFTHTHTYMYENQRHIVISLKISKKNSNTSSRFICNLLQVFLSLFYFQDFESRTKRKESISNNHHGIDK